MSFVLVLLVACLLGGDGDLRDLRDLRSLHGRGLIGEQRGFRSPLVEGSLVLVREHLDEAGA